MNARAKGEKECLIIISKCVDLITKLHVFMWSYARHLEALMKEIKQIIFRLDIMFLNKTHSFHKK